MKGEQEMSTESIINIGERLVRASRNLHNLGMVRGTSGNISARIPGTDTVLIKPSGAQMGLLHREELVQVSLKGNGIDGKTKVSTETPMHTAIYKTRKDVGAVVHTHAPTATAFGIAGIEILPLQIEMFMLLPKGVPIVPFESPGSKKLAKAVQDKIAEYDALILENHGLVTVGSTIEAACNLNEMVEEGAKVQYMAMTLSRQKLCSLDELTNKFKKHNAIE
jgi:L-fuculose-phosphate aldolase